MLRLRGRTTIYQHNQTKNPSDPKSIAIVLKPRQYFQTLFTTYALTLLLGFGGKWLLVFRSSLHGVGAAPVGLMDAVMVRMASSVTKESMEGGIVEQANVTSSIP
jgi:hypothetical protein